MVNRMQPVGRSRHPGGDGRGAARPRRRPRGPHHRRRRPRPRARTSAAPAPSAATARFDQARRDTDDLSRRAALAARLLPEQRRAPRRPPQRPRAAGRGPPPEYQALDDALGEPRRRRRRRRRARGRARPPPSASCGPATADEPEPLDQADAAPQAPRPVEPHERRHARPGARRSDPTPWQPSRHAGRRGRRAAHRGRRRRRRPRGMGRTARIRPCGACFFLGSFIPARPPADDARRSESSAFGDVPAVAEGSQEEPVRIPIRTKLAGALAVPLLALVGVAFLRGRAGRQPGRRRQAAETELATAAVGPDSLIDRSRTSATTTRRSPSWASGPPSTCRSTAPEARAATDAGRSSSCGSSSPAAASDLEAFRRRPRRRRRRARRPADAESTPSRQPTASRTPAFADEIFLALHRDHRGAARRHRRHRACRSTTPTCAPAWRSSPLHPRPTSSAPNVVRRILQVHDHRRHAPSTPARASPG